MTVKIITRVEVTVTVTTTTMVEIDQSLEVILENVHHQEKENIHVIVNVVTVVTVETVETVEVNVTVPNPEEEVAVETIEVE